MRSNYVRPITVAITFTVTGEALIFIIWGVYLFPEGIMWHKAVWTATCGLAMGATIGALVNVLVTDRMAGINAAIASWALYMGVLAFCVGLCFRIDLATGGRFGADSQPILFVVGGLAPALISSFIYVWLLYSEPGKDVLARWRY